MARLKMRHPVLNLFSGFTKEPAIVLSVGVGTVLAAIVVGVIDDNAPANGLAVAAGIVESSTHKNESV
jgi:hypothetical protein